MKFGKELAQVVPPDINFCSMFISFLKSHSSAILHRIHAKDALLEGSFTVFPVASLSTGSVLADGSRAVAAFMACVGDRCKGSSCNTFSASHTHSGHAQSPFKRRMVGHKPAQPGCCEFKQCVHVRRHRLESSAASMPLLQPPALDGSRQVFVAGSAHAIPFPSVGVYHSN
jgi:hypothetical protein